MLPVVWSHSARADLFSVVDYIAKRNPAAAARIGRAIRASTWPLPEHPYLFKKSERMPGCREIVAHPNYVIIYRVEASRISVLRVLHARRQYP